MVYTIAEKVEIISLFYKNGECARQAAQIFNDRHPDKNTSHRYILDLVHKFSETGSIANKKHQRQQVVRNEGNQIAVLGHIAMEPNLSLRNLASTSGISVSSCHRILKIHKYHPYKISLVQELNEDDPDRRMQFCEEMSNRAARNRNFLYSVSFSDECSFQLNGQVNRHNCRYWSEENPRIYHEAHTQHPLKLNVWAGILGNHLIGPFFLPGNLNGDMYLNLLETNIYPLIVETLENDDSLSEDDIWFQQDGAPPHYAADVRDFLNTHFPNQWIGRRGSIEWPPRSPDLTPLDFFLWGHLKTKVYATQPNSLEELRQRIVEECRQITPEMLGNVRSELEQRFYYCMEAEGKQFEHLIK